MIRLIVVAVAMLVCVPTFAQTAPELQAHVEYLASDALEGRLPASNGMKEAIAYVRAQCKEIGLQTYSQPVNVRGGTCENVVAVLEGRDLDTRIVVGAHLDHIGRRGRSGESGGPWNNVTRPDTINNGADDNASGSACVLGLAKRLAAGPKPGCTIEFHWYTGEEQGLLGSKTYCKRPLADISQYRFMLNLDMVGRLERKKLIGQPTDLVVPLPIIIAPLDPDKILEPLYNKYLFADRITWASDTNDSDHSSWWKVGVPAVILHTGIHSDYHRATDEVEKVDFRGMVDVCDYAFDILRAVDSQLGPDVFVPPEPFDLY
jgi:Zn-dependent M28 family amino/carboxypeptidase